MEITITAGNPPRRVTAPLSKSEGHRAMILAALAEGETLLPVLPASDDVTATKECLRQMGAGITETAQGPAISVKLFRLMVTFPTATALS